MLSFFFSGRFLWHSSSTGCINITDLQGAKWMEEGGSVIHCIPLSVKKIFIFQCASLYHVSYIICWSDIETQSCLSCFIVLFSILILLSGFMQSNSRTCPTNGSSCFFMWRWHASVSQMPCCIFLLECSVETTWWVIQVSNNMMRSSIQI